jgi:hypothetical protein
MAGISYLAIIWFILTGIVISIDCAFVFLRPDTFPGGKLAAKIPIFGPWHDNMKFDLRFKALNDPWLFVISYLNVFEVLLQFYCVFLHFTKDYSSAHKFTFFVSTCTLYKTIIHFGLEIKEDWPYTKHNSQQEFWLNVILPASFWIFIPIILIFQSFRNLTAAQQRIKVD